MPHFIFAYHGGKTPGTPEETEAEIGRWQNWFDSIGDAIIDPGNPVGMAKTVSAAGVSDDGGRIPCPATRSSRLTASTARWSLPGPARSSARAVSRWRKSTR